MATHTGVWQKSATASCANRLAMRNSPRSAILLLRVIRVLHSLRNGDPGNKPTSRCPRCFCSQTAGRGAPLPAPPRPGAPHPAPWVRPSQPHRSGHPRPVLSFRHRPGLPLRGAGRAGGVGRPRCVLAAPASPTQLTSRPTAPGFLVCSHRPPGLCSVQPNPSTWEVLDERSLGAVGRALV